MDKQLIFFSILAILFLSKGVVSRNPIMLTSGIVLALLPVYEYFFNIERKNYKKNFVRGINFITILGNVDLLLGVLLLTDVTIIAIPFWLILPLTALLILKAIIFVRGGDIASVCDIVAVVIIFSSVYFGGNFSLFIIIISIYLIQKGILSNL